MTTNDMNVAETVDAHRVAAALKMADDLLAFMGDLDVRYAGRTALPGNVVISLSDEFAALYREYGAIVRARLQGPSYLDDPAGLAAPLVQLDLWYRNVAAQVAPVLLVRVRQLEAEIKTLRGECDHEAVTDPGEAPRPAPHP